MKPTILFVYPNEFNPQLGGIERVTDLLTKELIERGYDVKYLNVVKSGIEYKFPAPVFYFPSQMVKDPINTVFYKQFLKEQKIDIVVNQDVCSR
ncbi:glycosyltransferase family 4 protein, partial [Bacteroides salyersiae]